MAWEYAINKEFTMAWKNWYHIMFNPYGQWLRGDPRGWRERNHRLHVEGDYKNPPAPSGYNDHVLKKSKESMEFPEVTFSKSMRRDVGVLLLESFAIQKIEVLSLAVGMRHVHLLAQCPKKNPKVVTGKAKNNVWMKLVNGGDKLKAKANVRPFWALGSHAEPIADRSHQVEVFWYVIDHRKKGAWVWCYRDLRDGAVSCRHERERSARR